ncbi:MAG: hypothetical protein R2734_15520 [Nocardioides sp.]
MEVAGCPERPATLDRTHDPLRVPAAVAWAQPGFEQVSLDLIYGTPGVVGRLGALAGGALACEPNHVSAYSLIVEEGTALARRVRRGELPPRRGRPRRQVPPRRRAADGGGLRDGTSCPVGSHPWGVVATTCSYWTGADWWASGRARTPAWEAPASWNVRHPPRTPSGWRVG